MTYGCAIRGGYHYLLANYPDVFAIGQGVWSPWYVGDTMTDLEKEFGIDRVIDTPVSEQATSGVGIGASLCGYRAIVSHPRVDFALLAVDQIVNQAAKWSTMFGGKAHVPVTFRCIVNRGGQQGAQHSQTLHSWFAHVPGLRVVMPSSPTDARDLLVASVLSDDPVIFMDDRWLYEVEEEVAPIVELDLAAEGPVIRREGTDVTLVGAGHSAWLCLRAADTLASRGVACEVIDVRIPGPLDPGVIVSSVERTGRLLAVDGDWSACGLAGELIAGVTESLDLQRWRARPARLTLPAAPAPTSAALEDLYYPTASQLGEAVMQLVSP